MKRGEISRKYREALGKRQWIARGIDFKVLGSRVRPNGDLEIFLDARKDGTPCGHDPHQVFRNMPDVEDPVAFLLPFLERCTSDEAIAKRKGRRK